MKKILPYLQQAGYEIGLASSSKYESVINHLKRAEMIDYFSVIVTGDMIEHSKPKPDIYLLACRKLGVEYVEDSYEHEDWIKKVGRGREDCPERGPRCLECFKYRLKRAAEFGEKQGCKLLTTTLASSRWKSLEQINQAGRQAVEGKQIQWWDMNWRKGGLQERRCELIKELGFYNQTFCGCEFSQNLK